MVKTCAIISYFRIEFRYSTANGRIHNRVILRRSSYSSGDPETQSVIPRERTAPHSVTTPTLGTPLAEVHTASEPPQWRSKQFATRTREEKRLVPVSLQTRATVPPHVKQILPRFFNSAASPHPERIGPHR